MHVENELINIPIIIHPSSRCPLPILSFYHFFVKRFFLLQNVVNERNVKDNTSRVRTLTISLTFEKCFFLRNGFFLSIIKDTFPILMPFMQSTHIYLTRNLLSAFPFYIKTVAAPITKINLLLVGTYVSGPPDTTFRGFQSLPSDHLLEPVNSNRNRCSVTSNKLSKEKVWSTSTNSIAIITCNPGQNASKASMKGLDATFGRCMCTSINDGPRDMYRIIAS